MSIEDGDGYRNYIAVPQPVEPRLPIENPGRQLLPHEGQLSHALYSTSRLSAKVDVLNQGHYHPQCQEKSRLPFEIPRQQQQHQTPLQPPQALIQDGTERILLTQLQKYHQPYHPSHIEPSYIYQPAYHCSTPSANNPVGVGPPTFTSEEVDKFRMLRQAPFNYFSLLLENERQRCAGALQRYNHAYQLASGLSVEATQGLLEMVVKPTKDKTHSFLVPCTEEGALGKDVKIEAPFTTSYGYNLKVHDGVFIQHHCIFDDAAIVEIGSKTCVGPKVTIISSEMKQQIHSRAGVSGEWIARPVTIGSSVRIGANATIYQGVSIGHGATVMAGAVVTESLEEGGWWKA